MVNADERQKFTRQGLTFDDVLLIPVESDVLPADIDLHTQLICRTRLDIPLVSAAMGIVTEYRMAIAIIRESDIDIIHKDMPIDAQTEQMDMVKRSENGVITNSSWLVPGHTLAEADGFMTKYYVSGVPIYKDGKLIDIITNRDMKFGTDIGQLADSVMTRDNLVTAREGATLEEAKEILRHHKIEKLPIVDDKDHLGGLITIKDIEKVTVYPNSARNEKDRLLVGTITGAIPDVLDRVHALVEAGVNVSYLSSVHDHSNNTLECVHRVKALYPGAQPTTGNVVAAKSTRTLIEADADCVKIGISPGSICTIRVVAGINIPQIATVYDAACVVAECDVPIIADGDVKYSGDLAKALATGANVVMLDSLLAGCEESFGDTEVYQGRQSRVYHNMDSLSAVACDSKDRYLQQNNKKLVPESMKGRMPYKGPTNDTIYQLMGDLWAGTGYTGCHNVEKLYTKAQLMQIVSAGLKESHPHDIYITKKTPNYTLDPQQVVERITTSDPSGGFSAPIELEQKAAERPGRYEDTHGHLLARQEGLAGRMEVLEAQERQKTAQFRGLSAEKLTIQNTLTLRETYGIH